MAQVDERGHTHTEYVQDAIVKMKAIRGRVLTSNSEGGELYSELGFSVQDWGPFYPEYIWNDFVWPPVNGEVLKTGDDLRIVSAIQQEALREVITRLENTETALLGLQAGPPMPTVLEATSTAPVLLDSEEESVVVTLQLPLGSWDVTGVVQYNATSSATLLRTVGYLTSDVGAPVWYSVYRDNSVVNTNGTISSPVPAVLVHSDGTTEVHLRMLAKYATGDCTGQGYIRAIKVG